VREVLVHPGWWALAAACWLAACAVPLAVIDATARRLPDWLTIPAWSGTLALLAPAGWPAFTRALFGGLALSGFYLALVLISPSGMGLGDVKAAGSLGSLLAWASWRALFFGGFAGFVLAAVYSLALLAARRITRQQQIPFGPFMILGAFAVLLALPAR
jgi:leader peptidase (prepilin peptidase) / N-methyltransferase